MKRRPVGPLTIAIALAAAASTEAQAAPVLLNGSFEENNVTDWDAQGYGYGYAYAALGVQAAPWSFEHGAGLSRDDTAWGGTTPLGDHFAFLQGAGASLSQSFELDQWYDLFISVQATTRLNFGHVGAQVIQVNVDGTPTYRFQPGVSWSEEVIGLFDLAPGMHTISFVGLYSGGDSTAFLDGIGIVTAQLSPPPGATDLGSPSQQVPEPASALLLGIALAGIGMETRRKLVL